MELKLVPAADHWYEVALVLVLVKVTSSPVFGLVGEKLKFATGAGCTAVTVTFLVISAVPPGPVAINFTSKSPAVEKMNFGFCDVEVKLVPATDHWYEVASVLVLVKVTSSPVFGLVGEKLKPATGKANTVTFLIISVVPPAPVATNFTLCFCENSINVLLTRFSSS